MKFAIIFLILVSVQLVAGFGASAPYWDDRPLRLMQGEQEIVEITLQNLVGNEDITLQATIVQGNDIAKIVGPSEINVPFGTRDIVVPIEITIPEQAFAYDTYPVSIGFTPVKGETSDFVRLSSAIGSSFDVIVEPDPSLEVAQSRGMPIFYGALVMIGLLIGIVGLALIRSIKRHRVQR